ncbi:MAG: rhamnogalacturonan acetylesterase [Acidobacteriia bacterium]|nr:rhamnogalacturonan acetylesterase [Terriglobia bacterium]
MEGIRQAKLPIAKYLVSTPPFDAAHPDPFDAFAVPAEPGPGGQRPYGDAAAAQKIPTVFVIGDSTASNADHRGWADPFASYFDAAKANVVNRARGGRSSRTFFTEGLWQKVVDELKPGDFVLIQFGHNDGGAPDRPPFRGSLPGLGDESKDIAMRDGKTETVHTFGWYMRRFLADTKAKGATPIALSPTVRNIWTGATVERGPGHYAEWAAEIAKAEAAPFIDVTGAIAERYEKMGPEKVKALFPQDHTHTSAEGADLNASLVVAGIRGLRASPLAAFLNARGQAVAPYPLRPLPPNLVLKEPKDPALPTLFLIGDSTVRNGSRGDGSNGQWGWGEPLVDLFDASRINVVNRAVGGLSSRTFLTQGFWDHVRAMMKPGDFVIMQFGHNDGGPADDPARARGSLPGAGEETREIENPMTKQREAVHTFGWYLRRFITDARTRGATPIVASLVPRKIWKDGKIERQSDTYQKWAAEVAAAEKAPYLDLNETIARRYDEIGAEKVNALFADEHTHTTRAGAELNAECVVACLKALGQDPLAAYLSEKGKAVTAQGVSRRNP